MDSSVCALMRMFPGFSFMSFTEGYCTNANMTSLRHEYDALLAAVLSTTASSSMSSGPNQTP